MIRTKVFISYSHNDIAWLKRLQVHLKPLERKGLIERWDDTHIEPGEKWRTEIKKALARTQVAVLLVSADFLASDYIAENELPPLLASAEREGTVILPIILSPCFVEQTPIAQFQAVNPLNQPVIAMIKGDQEQVFVDVAKSIQSALEKTSQVRIVDLGDPASFDLEEFDECLEDLLRGARLVGISVAISPESSRNFPTYLEKRLKAVLTQLSGEEPFTRSVSLKASFGSVESLVNDLKPYKLLLNISDVLLSVRADDEDRLVRFWNMLSETFNSRFEYSFLALIIKESQFRSPQSINHDFPPPEFHRNHVVKWVNSLANNLTDDRDTKRKLITKWTDAIVLGCTQNNRLCTDRVYDHIELSLDVLNRQKSIEALYQFFAEWKRL